MSKNRSIRLVFALVVGVSLCVIGRNVYRHYQENALEKAITICDEGTATDLLKQGVFADQPSKLRGLLNTAVMKNEPDVVRALLHQGVNPNLHWIRSPLLIAVSDCPSVVDVLLDRGANVNEQESGGETALLSAIESHRLETMRLLLDRGADVNVKGTGGINGSSDGGPLVRATQWGDMQAVKMLLERGANVDDVLPQTAGNNLPRQTALEAAVKLRRSALVPLLAAHANQVTKSKALDVAVTTGSVDIVRILLAAGARPAPQSDAWQLALYTAGRQSERGKSGYAETLALLRPFGVTATSAKMETEARNLDGQTALITALSESNTAEAQHLLAQGANVNAVDKQGRTPLMEAVEHGSSLISALLAKGANPNILTTLGNTPLYQAVLSNNVAVARLLLAHGANPNLHLPHVPNLLERARKHNQAEMVTLLQQAGAKE